MKHILKLENKWGTTTWTCIMNVANEKNMSEGEDMGMLPGVTDAMCVKIESPHFLFYRW